MAKRRSKQADMFMALDPLGGYPEMMAVLDVAEFAGISQGCARKWVQENGGVIVTHGKQRDTWRIHKEYVRKAFNVPRITA